MRVSDEPPLHLTYCLNIHPGETWSANLAAIRDKACRVRDAVAPSGPFGLGLRLSALAAAELAEPPRLADFRRFLGDHGLYVFTINGFPYGPFHGTAVKREVYRPDWRAAERRDYTVRLIGILAALLPEGVPGSVSTVPGAYKPWIRSRQDVEAMGAMLGQAAAAAAHVRAETGRDVCIALEPEPDCFIETTQEAVEFLTRTLPETPAAGIVAERLGVSAGEARAALARHVGLCFDTAHAAVQFENPAGCLRRIGQAGVRIAKVQLSAALRLRPTDAALEGLGAFADPVYLHQARLRGGGGRVRAFDDLPPAIAAVGALAPAEREGAELRVHFHVPLFHTEAGGLGSTSELLDAGFWRLVTRAADAPTQHLEIETYTFGVLPEALRLTDVTDSIAGEYAWVLARLRAASR